jgi:hypothetical protein
MSDEDMADLIKLQGETISKMQGESRANLMDHIKFKRHSDDYDWDNACVAYIGPELWLSIKGVLCYARIACSGTNGYHPFARVNSFAVTPNAGT